VREEEVCCLVNRRVLFFEFVPLCWCCVLFSSAMELHTISLCVIAPICVLQGVVRSDFLQTLMCIVMGSPRTCCEAIYTVEEA
jgi:hypothetical protein